MYRPNVESSILGLFCSVGAEGLVEVKEMIVRNAAPSLAYQSKEHRTAKILVIEDDGDIRQVICLFLQLSGFEVREALDGRQAIHIIPEFCPDLLVLDLMMRPVDGWVVL